MRGLGQQLERELGVTYKTARRMFSMIRNQLMTDDGEPLSGELDKKGYQHRRINHSARIYVLFHALLTEAVSER